MKRKNLTIFSGFATYENANLNEVVFRELYIQVNDPGEMENLINKPSYKKQKEKMQEFIEDHKNNILNQ